MVNEYAVAKASNVHNNAKAIYTKLDLLILGEWLLHQLKLMKVELFSLHELIKACDIIVFCAQYDSDKWNSHIGCNLDDDENSAITKAILHRIINICYSGMLESNISRRKRHMFIAGSERYRND